MNLKDLLIIDKTINKPTIVEQVTSQIIELADNGLLTAEMAELPDCSVFAKEIGVSRVTGTRIYNRLHSAGYGYYNADHTFSVNCKGLAKKQLQESVTRALECGISFDEVVLEILKFRYK